MITVNFGPIDHGNGNKQPAERVKTVPRPKQAKPREATPAKPEERGEDVLTGDEEEAPVILPKRSTAKETPKPAPQKEKELVEKSKKPSKEEMEDILTHNEEEIQKAVPKKEEKPVWEPQKGRASVEGLKKRPKFTTAILSDIPNGPGNDVSAGGRKGKDAVAIASVKGHPGEQIYYCSCGFGWFFSKDKAYYLPPQEMVQKFCRHLRY